MFGSLYGVKLGDKWTDVVREIAIRVSIFRDGRINKEIMDGKVPPVGWKEPDGGNLLKFWEIRIICFKSDGVEGDNKENLRRNGNRSGEVKQLQLRILLITMTGKPQVRKVSRMRRCGKCHWSNRYNGTGEIGRMGWLPCRKESERMCSQNTSAFPPHSLW